MTESNIIFPRNRNFEEGYYIKLDGKILGSIVWVRFRGCYRWEFTHQGGSFDSASNTLEDAKREVRKQLKSLLEGSNAQ